MSNYKTAVNLLIAAEVDGKPRHEYVLGLGDTPSLLVSNAGFSQLDMIITGKVIGKIHFDHGITASVIHRIPDLLGSPKAIYESASHPDSAVVMTFEHHRLSPVILIARKNMRVGRQVYNGVVSMYGKEGPNPENKWKRAGLLIWEP